MVGGFLDRDFFARFRQWPRSWSRFQARRWCGSGSSPSWSGAGPRTAIPRSRSTFHITGFTSKPRPCWKDQPLCEARGRICVTGSPRSAIRHERAVHGSRDGRIGPHQGASGGRGVADGVQDAQPTRLPVADVPIHHGDEVDVAALRQPRVQRGRADDVEAGAPPRLQPVGNGQVAGDGACCIVMEHSRGLPMRGVRLLCSGPGAMMSTSDALAAVVGEGRPVHRCSRIDFGEVLGEFLSRAPGIDRRSGSSIQSWAARRTAAGSGCSVFRRWWKAIMNIAAARSSISHLVPITPLAPAASNAVARVKTSSCSRTVRSLAQAASATSATCGPFSWYWRSTSRTGGDRPAPSRSAVRPGARTDRRGSSGEQRRAQQRRQDIVRVGTDRRRGPGRPT